MSKIVNVRSHTRKTKKGKRVLVKSHQKVVSGGLGHSSNPGMMLLTKEIRKNLPPLYAMEDKRPEDVPVVVKFFAPNTRWTWYATEFDGKDRFFGWVKSGINPDFDELGYFSLSELKGIKLPHDLKIERDRGFHIGKHTLADVKKKDFFG